MNSYGMGATTSGSAKKRTVWGAGLLVDALDINEGAGLLGLGNGGIVRLHTVQESLARFGVLDVLNADIDALGENAASNTLVNNDTDGTAGDVENASSGSVVDLVGHTLLDGTVAFDVDDIALAVASKVGLQANDTLLAEVLGEHVARSASDTLWVGHFVRFCLSVRQSKSDSK